ncbi:MAG: type II toxin-antitoxin system RelE family toxin [Aminivibrio sp.]
MILSYIDRNLHNYEDPRAAGKALKGPLKSLWRYRIGSYRLLAEIKDGELLIIAVDVGHRSEIYSGRGG